MVGTVIDGFWALGAVAVLILANGVFVATEFALVTVRRPQVSQRAEAGDWRARAVQGELSQLSYALSAAQFGITVTSLLVGYLIERALGAPLLGPMLVAVGLPEQASIVLAVALAFLLSTATQVVVGELVPKNIAIARPLEVALWLAPLTRAFGKLLRPLIRVFDGSASALARRVFQADASAELESGRSLDELSRIILASGEEGSLSDQQAALLGRAVDLSSTRIQEIMVPRPDIVWLDASDTFDDLRAAGARTGHSRFPVRSGTHGPIVGTVHIKDLLTVPRDDWPATSIERIATPTITVPEGATLRQLLATLRRTQRTFAIVIDEHGEIAGIVTLEDLLEQLVGDITDEFDPQLDLVRRAGIGRYVVDGAVRLEQLASMLGLTLPEGPYETVAGYLLDALGRIPEPGASVAVDGWSVTVLRVDDVRITEVVVAREGHDR